MPAFGEVLTEAEILRALEHIYGFCDDDNWPRGELNLPRALVTEKAFPENETVLTTSVGDGTSGAVINEVLYELMSDGDRLSELTRLVGRLRDASEKAEEQLSKEAEAEINLLARHRPVDHQVGRLIEAAKLIGNRGTTLADLYLQRCFHLVREEYVKLGQVERRLEALESGE